MRVSLNWLRDYVDFDVPTPKLVEMLDMSGTKVEAVHRPGEGVEGIVVAEVVGVHPHPNADNLLLVDVLSSPDGDTELVVCGASNFAPGDKVPFARVGAKLPGLIISERKFRGVTSRGMLCSGAELGVSKDHAGLLVLPPDSTLGQDVTVLLGLDDTILELEITPNRPDCMSMLGVAREVAALVDAELRPPETSVPTSERSDSLVTITIEDDQGCARYLGRYLEGLAVAPSPSWMATRLMAAGFRPISNVVDATNYALLELGHPLHAFDAAKVHDNHIVVRRARPGERLRTLDGVERVMHGDDLLIADPDRPLAIAGVIGGEHSEVSEATTDVILESAYFDPASVSFTVRRHQLRTEASARFMRGMDPEAVPRGAARAARLMLETGGGSAAPEVADAYPRPIERERIELRPVRTDHVLGMEISPSDQARYLRSVGLGVAERDGTLSIEVPTFRPDLRREEDVIEEVARLAGYDRLPSTLPPGRSGGLDERQRAERALKRTLCGFGLSEAWTTSFMSPGDLDALGLGADHPARRLVALANPTSEEEPVLRTTLLAGLLHSVARNTSQRMPGVALFEIARAYDAAASPERSPASLPVEPLMMAAACCGDRQPQAWNRSRVAWDFFGLKGALMGSLRSLRLPEATFKPVQGMPFHPGRAATVSLGKATLGAIGEIHPDVCARFGVPEGTVAFEIGLAGVFAARPERPRIRSLSRFPAVLIDVAVVVDESVPAQRVEEAIRDAGAPEVASVRLFDLYRGEQVPAGHKSLAYALEVRDPERTLTDEDAVTVRDRIVAALRERTGARLRG